MEIFTFKPIYQKRIWGGQNLNTIFGRSIPQNEKIGESWELVDRPEACSEIFQGNADQLTIQDLWSKRREEVFGSDAPRTARFPILIKLLDCVETLSVQVHPPASVAQELQGEPKTEMWYFLHTSPEAKIYAGLKKGITAEDFKNTLGKSNLIEKLHALPTRPGEAMFLPSGRVHAIGAGNVILEIQQNSDTTYRVDDFGRLDDQGKPRELHIEPAKKSIRFEDFEPYFSQPHSDRVLVCEYFSVLRNFMFPEEEHPWFPDGRSFQYHFVVKGDISVGDEKFKMGEAFLIPANSKPYDLKPGIEGAELITVEWGKK
ncbi:MAG: type I phosphomannose isomerase catalytic subunit [Verrucomicrobiota bacterium]